MTEEQRNARIHNILYSTDSREELAQRIVALEETCADMFEFLRNEECDKCDIKAALEGISISADVTDCDDERCDVIGFYGSMQKLRIEVD